MATNGRKYAIDQHPRKQEIVEAILRGESFRNISQRYGMDIASISRYASNVLKKDLAAYVANKSESTLRTIDGCVDELESIARLCKRLVSACENEITEENRLDVTGKKKDTHFFLKGYLQELRATVETIGRFLGMVKDINVVSNISIETSQFVSFLIEILEEKLKDQPELLAEIEAEFGKRV